MWLGAQAQGCFKFVFYTFLNGQTTLSFEKIHLLIQLVGHFTSAGNGPQGSHLLGKRLL